MVGEASDPEAGLELASRVRPDLLLVDLDPAEGAAEASLRRLRQAAPRTQVVIVGRVEDPAQVLTALRAGASGFITRSLPAEEARRLLAQARHGQEAVPDALTRRLLAHLRGEGMASAQPEEGTVHPSPGDLTEREREVLSLLTTGDSDRELAEALQLSESTVKFHVRNILAKLGVKNRTQAAVWATHHGLQGRSSADLESRA